ncbi:hypothetical protein [Thermobrachium celere]|uniref:hypothetical protein n=1 Tax=Thermobrachium celere TaxID=53422 RepID=UPI0019409B92|nr:hypothetical protein [Thermobrachium celere]GFR35909.1 hypothetical protein TCEA9_17210 [Thermobrachium celere]
MKKKELIDRAKYLSQQVDKSCGNFIPFILNCMQTAEEGTKTDEDKKQKFFKLLYLTQDDKINLSLLGGGKSVGNEYKNFIKDKIKIEIQNKKYIVKNEQLRNLTFDEIKIVFGYVNRLVEIHSKKTVKKK